MDSKLKEHSKLSFLYHLGGDFSGFDAGAFWDDAKIGLQHLNSFDKIAMVSDKDFIVHPTKAYGFLMPCEVRVSKNAEMQEATSWIVGEIC